jgi:hypothetical protein
VATTQALAVQRATPVGRARSGSVEKTLPRCKGQRGMKCSAEGPRMDVVIRP